MQQKIPQTIQIVLFIQLIIFTFELINQHGLISQYQFLLLVNNYLKKKLNHIFLKVFFGMKSNKHIMMDFKIIFFHGIILSIHV